MSADHDAPAILPGRYRHYKGQDYEVIALARHSETEEWMVVYRTLYGDFSLWVRPATMFAGTVEIDGVPQPRFAYLG
ncbi:DUF1653 domain-containing protein [Ideonella sp. BN130291]|uniref:DUF1653 domain-containing protein n=1 Tax=Ideonella sp. BN130291 TaxID=3112940 RepID=UPI002E273904|nr:DUF1653 domain-containing protein [Ideonella sp. BN130291]